MTDYASLIEAEVATVSKALCQAIVATPPEFFTKLGKAFQWSSPACQAAFIKKISPILDRTPPEQLIPRCRKLLEPFLEPSFFNSQAWEHLRQKILYLGQFLATPANSNGVRSGVAILLLDVENLQLDQVTERYLDQLCQYPIQIKIAFANWRNMGKQDVEFHQRGYELIHVPAGKDSADVKLATVGSSIFIHYPTAKEVLVCSSDGVLSHLCTTLQTHGMTVYLVRKQGEMLTIFNSKTGKTETRLLRLAPEISSIDQLLGQLQHLIKLEQQAISAPWIKVARLAQLFHAKYHLTISQVVDSLIPGQSARQLLLGHSQIFALHRPIPNGNLYITLFDSGFVSNLPQGFTPTHETGINSRSDLEAALANLVREIIMATGSNSVYIGVLGNQFSKRYGQKITTVVKNLKLGSSFTAFLQSSSLFQLVKNGSQSAVILNQ